LINKKNFYDQKLEPDDICKHAKVLDYDKILTVNEKRMLKPIVSATLLALAIFKPIYENYTAPTDTISNDLDSYFEMCFTLAHSICFFQVEPSIYIRSTTSLMCRLFLSMPFCAYDQGGWGNQYLYFAHLILVPTNQIHNTYFKRRFPYKYKLGNQDNVPQNSLLTYVARLIFCKNLSPMSFYVK